MGIRHERIWVAGDTSSSHGRLGAVCKLKSEAADIFDSTLQFFQSHKY